jgi:hypothetical protein
MGLPSASLRIGFSGHGLGTPPIITRQSSCPKRGRAFQNGTEKKVWTLHAKWRPQLAECGFFFEDFDPSCQLSLAGRKGGVLGTARCSCHFRTPFVRPLTSLEDSLRARLFATYVPLIRRHLAVSREFSSQLVAKKRFAATSESAKRPLDFWRTRSGQRLADASGWYLGRTGRRGLA